jgi:WD40 repeat protein
VGLAAWGAALAVVAVAVAVVVLLFRVPLFGAERPLRTLSGIGPSVSAATFSPDGQLVAARTLYGLQFWDVATGNHRGELRMTTPVTMQDTIAFAPDGRTFGWLGRDGQMYRWDLAWGEPVPPEPFDPGAWATISSSERSALSPDGRVRAAGNGKFVTLSEEATGRELRTIHTAHADAIRSLTFSPDGRALLTIELNGTMMLWDVAGLPR